MPAESVQARPRAAKPVTPNAAPEAVELLKLIYSLSGKHTMTGQHNFPNTKDTYTRRSAQSWGKVPAVYGQDMGFAKGGDKDPYLARPDIVAECKRQYGLGAIVTICRHAVPPTADEPVVFAQRRGTPEKLASVQGKLTDEQFQDVLTPGTELYQHWCAQVDAVAGFLKQLQKARVPVLWRPYHEMNGDDSRSWSLSDPDYVKAITPLRKASGLPPVAPAPPQPKP
jgi:mannan endo-1,4-beta-mannosidase